MDIKAFVFDLGNVLIDVDFSAGYFPLIGYHPQSSTGQEQPLQWFQLHNSGKLTSRQFYLKLKERFRLQENYAQFREKWCNVFKARPYMEELLQQLLPHYSLALLSDTDPLHWNYCLERFSYLRLLNPVGLSYKIGALKPAPETYRYIVNQLNLKPQECLFIDDKPENVAGAQNFGMSALLYYDYSQLLKELRRLNLLPK